MSDLKIDSLTKSFKNKILLRDIYLCCKKGEIVGLMGRNGSGKSTLLKIIFGTVDADSKFVKVGSKSIKGINDSRNLINYLPQDNFLPNNIKIKTLIKLFLSAQKWSSVLNNEYIKPLLQKQNQMLSGGEKRLVEILLLVHSDAEFILLDEPFNGLTPLVRDYVIGYIKDLKPEKGYIITDHDYENVLKLADNLVYLQDGFLRKINDERELVHLGYLYSV